LAEVLQLLRCWQLVNYKIRSVKGNIPRISIWWGAVAPVVCARTAKWQDWDWRDEQLYQSNVRRNDPNSTLS